MTGRRADGTNPRALGTNPRAQRTNPRALEQQLDRIESKQDEILRLLNTIHAQHRTGTHGPITLDDGSTFIPGTGTIGNRTLSDEARAALNQLDAQEHP